MSSKNSNRHGDGVPETLCRRKALFLGSMGIASAFLDRSAAAGMSVAEPSPEQVNTTSSGSGLAKRVTVNGLGIEYEVIGKGQPVVVGTYPYHYTYFTQAPALSIPAADDIYLLAYMRRYGARWVVLTEPERAFWRPRWQDAGGLPTQFRLAAQLENAFVYERVE